LCRRPVTETAVELANKLYFRVEARPPEEQIATRKAWFVDRRSLLVLDDIWENDLIALAGVHRSHGCANRADVHCR
jgi:hypothetical protein